MAPLLIVGGGLAGSILALQAHSRGIPFTWVVSKTLPSAFSAAYGMCNPVHFRNTRPAFKAELLFPFSRDFFTRWQKNLPTPFMRNIPVRHLVKNEEELIYWRQQVESTDLWKFTTGEPLDIQVPGIQKEFSKGIEVPDVFFVDIPAFVSATREYFRSSILWQEYDYSQTLPELAGNMYSHVVFTDGANATSNPHFNWVPFNPCKGQTLHLRIQEMELTYALHKKIVLVPMGGNEFTGGSTYEWGDYTDAINEKGKQELLDQLNEILDENFQPEVLDQKAGVRPAIADRRPVVGVHPANTRIAILNGFGTRGLLVGPYCSHQLLDHLFSQVQISSEWDVQRFKKRFERSLTANHS